MKLGPSKDFLSNCFHHSTIFLNPSSLSWIISTVSRGLVIIPWLNKCDWWEIRTLKHLSIVQSDQAELLWNCLACFIVLKIETTNAFWDPLETQFYLSFLCTLKNKEEIPFLQFLRTTLYLYFDLHWSFQ